MRTDIRTDITKLIVAFRNFANAPNSLEHLNWHLKDERVRLHQILQRNAIREKRRLEISANVFRRPFDSGNHRAVLGHLLSHLHCGYSPTSTPIRNKHHSASYTARWSPVHSQAVTNGLYVICANGPVSLSRSSPSSPQAWYLSNVSEWTSGDCTFYVTNSGVLTMFMAWYNAHCLQCILPFHIVLTLARLNHWSGGQLPALHCGRPDSVTKQYAWDLR
jgi:hypothetical protein